MSRTSNKSSHHYFPSLEPEIYGSSLIKEAFQALGIMDSSGRPVLEKLPFATDDATAGTETELQVAVHGTRKNVDLPIIIEQSNYFANIRKRTATGDLPKRLRARP